MGYFPKCIQFYNYVTKINLKDSVETDETISPSVPFVVMRRVSIGATETEGSEDTRTLASEPGLALGPSGAGQPGVSGARRSGSLSRLAAANEIRRPSTAASSDNELWKVRGRRMAIDLGERKRRKGAGHAADADDDDKVSNMIDEMEWRRGRRMAIDMTAMCDDVTCDDVIVDVEQIVATGGIFDAFTTDTGSDDSFLASLEHDPDSDRKCVDEPAPTSPAALPASASESPPSRTAADVEQPPERPRSSSPAELRTVTLDTANCVDGLNHMHISGLVDNNISSTVDAFNPVVQPHGNTGDVAAS